LLTDPFIQIDKMKRVMEKISGNMGNIRNLQAQILSSTNSQETYRITAQLDALNEDTSARLQKLRQRLKQLSAETNKLPPSGESQSRRGQQSTMAKKVMDLADEYQKIQSGFKQRYKQRIEREIKIGKRLYALF
jgi:syntaxin 1B/2/3